MMSRSPTLEGFRTILRRPSFGFAEISWRWSFGGAALLLIAFSALEYLNTLPVSRADLLLLKTRQPALVQQAIAHIFHGSGLRVVRTGIVLGLSLTVLWITIAALARAATVKALVQHFRADAGLDRVSKSSRFQSLVGLNFFRVAVTLAAAIGVFAAFVLGGMASPASKPAPGMAFLILMAVFVLVWLAWSTVNWLLSLASVFAVTAGRDTFGSISAAIDLCRDRTGSVFAAGTWFVLAHVVAFVIATSAVAFPLGFATVLPPAVVFGGVLVVTLIYFALADFLYMGRLAAYVAMVEFPPAPAPLPVIVPGSQGPPSALLLRSAVDQDEVILSDVPQ